MTTIGSLSHPQPPGTRLWWIAAGLVAAVILAFVVWKAFGEANDDPAPPPVSPTTEGPTPTAGTTDDVASQTPTADEWAGFPPADVSALPDLSNPQLPAQVLTYSLGYETKDSFSLIADYTDDETFVTLTLWFTTERSDYARTIALLQDPARFGGAVCGPAIADAEQLNCVMPGRAETVRVMTSSSDVTIADVAAFTEALYAGL
ncbi:MAG: hypothetical protein ABIS84_08920 [Arachnia sp.]